ncbi:PilZ domain-containing protein [Sphingomonas sp. SUN019]|uniref:PilZ domain-containing protein n=1 Tax=Sphingomonas sp. SUN019 TaxID=2937788 RepID=UPI0021647F28|nr:PilZ domain-containing protein [Sphingomonas sp. SUN019]UVO49539.1 PilZ domain-containing protein [Sphingomonas sp. SUN019]
MDQPDPCALASAESPAGNSGRQRDSLFLLAQLHVEGRAEPIAVRVRNLSAGGLMAELPHPVPTDRAIDIDVRGIGRITGRIAWQTAGRIGVAFDQPIDPQRARKPVSGTATAKR